MKSKIVKVIMAVFVICMLFNVNSMQVKAATTYKIKYHHNGGKTTTMTDKVTKGKSYTFKKSGFTRTGYTLSKWNSAANGSGKNYALGKKISSVSKSYEVYSVWTPNKYTVTFNPNGGNVSTTSKSVTYASTYGALPTPTRTGYIFLGWYTTTSGGTKVVANSKVGITKALTLYANWQPITYSVYFNGNGGSNAATKNIKYGTHYGTLPTIKRDGYTFEGWYTAATGGTAVTSSTVMNKAAGHTLYAHWTEHTYNIKYHVYPPDKNGHSWQYEQKNIKYTSDIVLYEEIYVGFCGYKLTGWNTLMSGKGQNYELGQVVSSLKGKDNNNETINLYAVWTPREYTFVYDKNGGEGEKIPSHKGTYTEQVQLSENTYTKVGYNFAGWGFSPDSKRPLTDNMIVFDKQYSNIIGNKDTIVLYAIWAPNEVTIEFYSEYSTDTELKPITLKFDEVIRNLPKPVYKKYNFQCWETEDGEQIYDGYINRFTKKKIVLYASTYKKTFEVLFYPYEKNIFTNVCLVEMDDRLFDVNIEEPMQSGYKFEYWYVIDNGVEVPIDLNYKFTTDTKIYAKWYKIPKPKKVNKLKAKMSGKYLNISFKQGKADGYIIKYKYKENYVNIFISANKLKKQGNKYVLKVKKIPETKIKIKKLKKIKMTVTPYVLDSMGLRVDGKGTTVTCKRKK